MKHHMHRFRTRAVTTALALMFAAHTAWAVDPFKVRDIRVEGLQRVEPGTVFASLPFRVGDNYSDEQGSAAIRALFGLGLFTDVRIEVSGDVLVVVVEERPTVADVEFVGTKEFDKDALKKSMRDVGLTEGRPFDKALADRAEQELKRQYINRSLYGAEVVTTVTPIERNRVNLTFTITEAEPAKLNADIETLRSYYLTRGYLEFQVETTQVAISPDKQDIAITLNITEGERYVVSSVRLEGNYLGKDDEFKSLVTIRPGEAYNADRVAETTKAFRDNFGNFGFAFANVEARPDIDRSNNSVALLLVAEPSRRAYVRRVNVVGNTRTRDEVIRREFRQFESSWYDGNKIRLSRDRVDRLGYFKEVNMETQEVAGVPDQVDLQVGVEEKPTGSLQLGAGFSSAEKLALSFGIKQENAFGSGNYLGLDINTSKFNRTIVLNTVDPYFTTDGVSLSMDLFHRNSRPYNDQGGNYQLETTGAGIRFGVPFSEIDTVYFGGTLERTTIKPGTNIPAAYLAYAEKFGYTSYSFPLSIGWSRDNRDSTLVPTTGRMQKVNAELGVAGDTRYLRSSYQYQQYIPLNKQYTLAFNGEVGYGKGLSGRRFAVFK